MIVSLAQCVRCGPKFLPRSGMSIYIHKVADRSVCRESLLYIQYLDVEVGLLNLSRSQISPPRSKTARLSPEIEQFFNSNEVLKIHTTVLIT